MRLLAWFLALALIGAVAGPAVRAQAPVATEFRVFQGTEEVTSRTRLVVAPTGAPENKHTLAGPGPRETTLAPGLYDVQMLKLEGNAVTAVVRVERLLVLHYPDEGGRHLEVLNFDARYGALQVKSAARPVSAYSFGTFPARTRQDTIVPAATGSDYVLFVVPNGNYDLQFRPSGATASGDDAHWILDLEVPRGRTRLKVIE